MAYGTGQISKRLILSYIFDWIILIIVAGIGAAISYISPNKRPFDLTEASISFPLVEKEKVPTGLLAAIALIVPGIITFVVCAFNGLGLTTQKAYSRTKAIKRALWELHAAWIGLALSLTIAFFITNGTKNMVGKPRPNLLARCNPDLSRLLNSTVGGIGDQIDEGKPLVSWTICKNPGSTLDEGFRSFPSGHSSFSFAGMTYLSLFLCAKLAVTIPFLNYHSLNPGAQHVAPPRRQAAAPPTYLLAFPLAPICLAIYICSTRYSDFMHHGFDIISGAILGIASAWLGFRWYHMPISRGAGWAWAPRSYDRAFGRGIGVLTYVNNEKDVDNNGRDVENGHLRRGQAGGGEAMRTYRGSEGGDSISLENMDYSRHLTRSDSSQRPLR